MGKAAGQSPPPFSQSRFSAMNFLTAAYQRYDYCPNWDIIHNLQQDFGLGNFVSHFCFIAMRVPSPLRLVENDHMLGAGYRFWAKMSPYKIMHILNED